MVVALQEERTRFGFVAIECAAGGAGDFNVVVIHLAVAQDGDVAADEGDIESGPFAEAVFRAGGRRVVAVDCSHFMRGLRAAFGANLHFIATAQIDVPLLPPSGQLTSMCSLKS